MISISDTGVGIHDAPWQSCCFGPGSERSAHASRGTIHVPSDRAAVLYGWSDVGTPVVVLPGDGTPVSRQTGAMNRPGEALHQRPLKLPAVGAGAACPGSPQRSLPIARTGSKSAAPDYGFGPGPAYLSGQLGWYAGAPGQAVDVVVDPSYSGPLLIRVRRLDGTGTADLQPEDPPPAGLPGAAPPGTAGSDGVDVHVTGAPPAWTAWMGRLTLDSPGCYGMQVDGAGFTSDIVFRVQPGPIPPG